MLPTPFEEFIPKLLRDSAPNNAKGQAFIDKIDANIIAWAKEALEVYWIKRPERCPANFLDAMGEFLNAGIYPQDTQRIKRQKLESAVRSHKLRGTWKFDTKIKIDLIAGGDAQILHATDSSDWIMLAGEADDPAYYWGTMGYDGIDDDLGLDLVGAFTEFVVAGNIYIDTDNNALTSDEIAQIVLNLTDVVPAYTRIYLGYVDGSGNFITYTTIG